MTTTNKNKIEYGLSNVHYAKITGVSNGKYTYNTPVAIPNGVAITLSQVGENVDLYADNTVAITLQFNQGYDGTITFLKISDEFRQDVLGETVDSAGVQIENADAIPSEFALLFQFEGDVTEKRHVLYRCRCQRPNMSSKTKTNSVEVDNQELSLTVRPRTTDKRVKAGVIRDTLTEAIYNSWFTSVYEQPPTQG